MFRTINNNADNVSKLRQPIIEFLEKYGCDLTNDYFKTKNAYGYAILAVERAKAKEIQIELKEILDTTLNSIENILKDNTLDYENQHRLLELPTSIHQQIKDILEQL